jgi:hypothetical protein
MRRRRKKRRSRGNEDFGRNFEGVRREGRKKGEREGKEEGRCGRGEEGVK